MCVVLNRGGAARLERDRVLLRTLLAAAEVCGEVHARPGDVELDKLAGSSAVAERERREDDELVRPGSDRRDGSPVVADERERAARAVVRVERRRVRARRRAE